MSMIGGGGFVDFFYVKQDHSAIVKTAGGDVAITGVGDRAIRIGRDKVKGNLLVSTEISIDESGVLSATFKHTKFDATWNTFVKNCVSRTQGVASTDVEEITDETGVKIGGKQGGTNAQQVLMVSYGAKDSDNKIPVTVAIGTISQSTNSFTFEANTYVKPSLKFTSTGCLAASGLDVGNALDVYDSSTNPNGVISGTPTPSATLEKNTLYDIFFLAPKV